MKIILFSIAAFWCFSIIDVSAQDDSTKYINGLPVSDDDTARVEPADIEPKNRVVAIPSHKLPKALREVLDDQEIYKGWQDTTVYFEMNTGIYRIPVRSGPGSVKIFGLNKNGDPLTYDEVTTKADGGAP